jgi:glycosyltransferase involved in cell wall biosynthesis
VLGRDKCTYEHALALGTPTNKLSLLRISNFNAAFNSYNPEQLPAKPAEYPYLLLVGRLVEIKYPLDVLAAFDLAAPHLPEYRLVIIGDGALRDDVEQRKELSEYKDRIVLLGACSSDIVFNWTAHATVAICPFSGSTVAEAMLCGKPIISYFAFGHPELIIGDYNGYIVPFRNIEALAEKIVHVVRNYEEARIVGMRSRELARVVLDIDKIREKESMYYRQALTDS